MSITVDLAGLDRIATKLRTLTNIDASPLMETWRDVIEDDNRTGVLAGLDKDGVPMVPVTYRPLYGPSATRAKQTALAKARKAAINAGRHGQAGGKRTGRFIGIGVQGTTINNNLTSAQYRLLAGPPLAPRDQFSRVITNLKTAATGPPKGVPNWQAIGAWDEVVSTKGVPFLRFHFEGIGQKRRDLRGVRPSGMAKAVTALGKWAALYVREHFGK